MPFKQQRLPPAFKKKLRPFLNLKTEEEVAAAMAEAGAILPAGKPFNAVKMKAAEREAFKRSWNLTTEDEVDEALELAGLVTVVIGDLAQAATAARHPLIVAKAISAAAHISDEQLRKLVPVLRKRGCSWTDIGTALGITKQSAWERFSGED
jgi:hypothetical protein